MTAIFVRMYKVQEVFGVSKDTVLRAEKKGEIEVLRRGRTSLVRTEDMEKFLSGEARKND